MTVANRWSHPWKSLRRLVLAAAVPFAAACWGGDTPLECEPPAQTRPVIALPTIPESEYLVELERWGIAADGTQAEATTDGINAAIAWAVANGYGRVRLPAGTYLVGKDTGYYSEAIELESNMALVMDAATVLTLAPNDNWAYCVVAVTGKHDVGIFGGAIRGDRDAHDYTTEGAHEEGHGICIQNQSERVLVDGVQISDPIGDGILIVGQGGDGTFCKDVTVTNSNISRGRRQGISIVGGVNVDIAGNEIHHIEGTAPQFGIDIESMSYESRDIVIRTNSFHHNRGGDYVNCDGDNVWFEDNQLDQGDDTAQTDGPLVFWKNTSQTIRGNTIRVTTGGSNGHYGIVAYSDRTPRTNPAANVIDGNTITGGGVLTYATSIVHLKGNTVEGGWILGDEVTCLRLNDNSVTVSGETYKFRNVRGQASGNIANGEPVDLPMTDDEPYTNSPPHLW